MFGDFEFLFKKHFFVPYLGFENVFWNTMTPMWPYIWKCCCQSHTHKEYVVVFFLCKYSQPLYFPLLTACIRTEVLVQGFEKELQSRLVAMQGSRVELERLYALRVDDSKVDDEANATYKEDAMKAIRNCEASFTSYAGSIRSIKSVLETWLFALIFHDVYSYRICMYKYSLIIFQPNFNQWDFFARL